MNASDIPVEQAIPAAEGTIIWLVQWLKLGIETFGAALVGIGVVVAMLHLVRGFLARQVGDFTSTRLILARYLALALEFQLGADILSTAIAPGWEQIGKLGAIAVIRTGLNFFLSLELRQERSIRVGEATAAEASGGETARPTPARDG